MSRAFSLSEGEVENRKLIWTHQPVNLEFFDLRSKARKGWAMVVKEMPPPPHSAPCLGRTLGFGGKAGCQEGYQLTP